MSVSYVDSLDLVLETWFMLLETKVSIAAVFVSSHNAIEECCVTRKKRKNTQDSNVSSFETWKSTLEFQENSIFSNDLFLVKNNNNHSDVQQTNRLTALACTVDLVVVLEAILTSRQPCEKLQSFYENLMLSNFHKMAVLKKIWIVN